MSTYFQHYHPTGAKPLEHLEVEVRHTDNGRSFNSGRVAKRGLIVIILLLILCAAGGIGYWKYKKNAAKANQTSVQKNLQLINLLIKILLRCMIKQ